MQSEIRVDGEPRVTVVMLAYNHEEFLEEAITSVMAQKTKFNFELLIGDDCSKDGTLVVAKKCQDIWPGRITVLSSPTNLGMNANFKRLLLEANAEFLAFCEGDDFWDCPQKLQLQVDMMENCPEASFVYGDFGHCADVNGRRMTTPNHLLNREASLRTGYIFEELLDRIDIHISTILCRSDLVKRYVNSNLYDNELKLGDVPLILFLAASGKVLALDKQLSIYRRHAASATQSSLVGAHRIRLDHIRTVQLFERKFASDPDRIQMRELILKRLKASSAYAAANSKDFWSSMNRASLREWLRLLFMLTGPLFVSYIKWRKAVS